MTSSDPSLERYLADIRRLERVDEGEEQDLLAKAKAGSLHARNRLIKAHLRFVLKVALHYRNAPLPVPDLINEGVLGLARAIDSYEARGIKFITYAVWWIRSHIVRAIEDKGAIIRLAANEHARLRREKRKRVRGQEPVSRGPVRAFSPGLRPGGQEWEGWTDGSPLADEMHSGRRLEKQVQNVVSMLPGKEAFVIRNAFGIGQGEGCTLQEIAWDLGLSPERIRQLREKGLKRLREEASIPGTLSEWL